VNPTLWIEKAEIRLPWHATASCQCIGVVSGQQNSLTVDLVCYTYDGRACRGGMPKVYYTLVTVAKKLCGLNKQRWVTMATSLERFQPNFTTIMHAHRAKNGRVRFEIMWLERIIKPEALLALRVTQGH